MPLVYADAYLAPLANDEREERALEDVRVYGAFPAFWEERLQVLRVYVLICLESLSSPEDTFSAKLKQYQGEFRAALSQARSALAAESGEPLVFASVPLERS